MKRTMQNRILRVLSPMRGGTRFLVAAMLSGAAITACDVHGVSAPGTLSTMTVTPNATLAAMSTQQMTAVGRDADGRVVTITPTWSVAALGGTINSAGMFTAGAVTGVFANTVVATVGSVSASATMTVTAGVLASITVVPSPVTLAVGGRQQFVAVGKDAGGNLAQAVTTWSVVAGGGTIDSLGNFTAGGTTGTYTNTVQASSNGLKANATVVVTIGPLASISITPNPVALAVGAKQQFVALGRDAGGNSIAIATTWSVVAGGGTVDGGGSFTAGTTPGTFTNTITATSGTLSAAATVVVGSGALATITISPSPITLAANGAQQFAATGSDIAGNPVVIAPIWTVVANGGAISNTGLFTAGVVAGTFTNTIRASSGGMSGFATVVVTSGTLASITVTPNPVSVVINSAQQFVAVGKDAVGNVFIMAPTWSVVNGGGAINATGTFTAGGSAGTFANTVQATSGSISGLATVTVTVTAPPPPPTIVSITVTPNPVSMSANSTQQFVAVGKDAGGNVYTLSPTWSVANGGGVINATGNFTAGGTAGSFLNTIKATSGLVSGLATVTVTLPPPPPGLASITVTPNPASMAVNSTQQFVAVGKDSSGNVFLMTPTWSVVNGGGVINGTGTFTSGASAGTFANTVRATNGTISGTATVTVTATTPASVVNLGAAAPNGIMAGTAVTCVIGGLISANVSVSPGNTVTGFGPCVITGVQHLADAVAAQGQIDLTAAYNTLAGLPCSASNAIVANLGGTTKPAGVYCTASGIGVSGTLTLDGGGDSNATFVFQAGSSLTTAGNIVLINGAQAKNVYWVVGSSATLGVGSQWQGNVLTLASITMVDNATLLGRALARNGAVTLGANNTITLP
jgi:hypothetical protein